MVVAPIWGYIVPEPFTRIQQYTAQQHRQHDVYASKVSTSTTVWVFRHARFSAVHGCTQQSHSITARGNATIEVLLDPNNLPRVIDVNGMTSW